MSPNSVPSTVAPPRSGPPRGTALAVAGAAAALLGLGWFTVKVAVPNIVSSGSHSAEEEAVSRLREIYWAEDQVLAQGAVHSDGNDPPEFAFLGELAGQTAPRAKVHLDVPPLGSGRFRQVPPGLNDSLTIFASEGYLYTLYLPASVGGGVGAAASRDAGAGFVNEGGAVDGKAAARRFIAYAWPADGGKAGSRAFYIDQDERICETASTQRYSGVDKVPAWDAALPPPAAGGASGRWLCGVGSDGATWKPWKRKLPHPPRPEPALPTP